MARTRIAKSCAAACAVLAVAWPALAQEPTQPSADISANIVEFEMRPDQSQFAKAYPPFALLFGVEGSARMRCKASADLLWENCDILEETPTGWGFGNAALSLAPRFRLKALPREGVAIIPVRFRVRGSALFQTSAP